VCYQPSRPQDRTARRQNGLSARISPSLVTGVAETKLPELTVDTVIRIGVLTPHAAPGPEAEFAAMAPGRLATYVRRVADARGSGTPASPAALRALTTAPFLDRAAEQLLTDHPVDVIGYTSTTSAYVIGFDAEMAMLSRLSQLTGVAVAATCTSAVRALRVLQVDRIALIGAPWFDPEFNELGAAYFTSQGFDVVSSASAGLSQDPRAIEPAAVCEWTAHHVDATAEAVFIGGNGFRAAAAIEPLEAAIGRPVLTSNQVLLWQLLAQADDTSKINGYGRLFLHKPRAGSPG
jgi:maleate isomerase